MSEQDEFEKPLVPPKRRFSDDEEGAVSVDWVVLTAAIVGLAAGAGNTIRDAITTLSGTIETEVGEKTVDNGN